MKSVKPNPLTPIVEDDAAIEEHLKDANIPTLLMAIIHLTGDTSILDGDIQLKNVIATAERNGDLTEEQQASVRQRALVAIRNYREAGCPTPEPLDGETIRRMSSFIVGEEVTDEYLPMMYKEMAFDETYARPAPWTNPESEKLKGKFHVLIIGAGMSGILSGIRLNQLGIPYTIIEKCDDIGGTWRDNTYPGCRVDIPNHFYSFSFETNPDWSHHFSGRDELVPYFRSIVDKYDVEKNIQFGSEVEEAEWCEESSTWQVKVRRKDGSLETLKSNALVSAVGQLSRPKMPNIPGRETFKGPSCHTHGYDRSIDLAGKRVAVIGTASSGLQLITELANHVGSMTVFQRTAHWFWPTPEYHRPVATGQTWLLGHVPFYSNWYRFLLFWQYTDGIRHWFQIDPSWPHQDRSVNADNEMHRVAFTKYFTDNLKDRPDLLEKVLPKFPPFADRLSLNDGSYLSVLKQDNVELVVDGIDHIDETGIVDETGLHRDFDVIVYATGFNAHKFLYPMKIVGKGGVVLNEKWGDEGKGYLGITVPEFPNFFMIWGPGTSGGTGGSMIFLAECQTSYIYSAIQKMIDGGVKTIDCRPELYEDYYKRYREEADAMVWSTPLVGGWYKNDQGKVVATLPFRLVDYWNWTKEASLADYVVEEMQSDMAE